MNYPFQNNAVSISRKKNHLLQLIEQGENEMLDFKKEITSLHKISKTIVSFANHKGGIILIGVNDNKTIHGVNADEERHMIEQAINFYCKPQPVVEYREWNEKGKIVLHVKIEKGNDKPYYAKGEDDKWWVHIRVADKSLLASKVVVDVLKREQPGNHTLIKYSSKEKELLDFLKEKEKITLKEYCKLLNISRWRATKILVDLVSVGIIRLHTTEKTDFYTLS